MPASHLGPKVLIWYAIFVVYITTDKFIDDRGEFRVHSTGISVFRLLPFVLYVALPYLEAHEAVFLLIGFLFHTMANSEDPDVIRNLCKRGDGLRCGAVLIADLVVYFFVLQDCLDMIRVRFYHELQWCVDLGSVIKRKLGIGGPETNTAVTEWLSNLLASDRNDGDKEGGQEDSDKADDKETREETGEETDDEEHDTWESDDGEDDAEGDYAEQEKGEQDGDDKADGETGDGGNGDGGSDWGEEDHGEKDHGEEDHGEGDYGNGGEHEE